MRHTIGPATAARAEQDQNTRADGAAQPMVAGSSGASEPPPVPESGPGIAAPEPTVDFSAIDGLAPAATLPAAASAYRERGIERSRRGDLDGAIADLDQAVRLASDDAQAYRLRGNAWGRKGDTDRALADYAHAIRLDPDDPASFHDRARIWQQIGELDKALVDFDHSIRLSFAGSETGRDRGAVWLIKDRNDRVLADFDRAITTHPHLAVADASRVVALEYAHADRDQASHLDEDAPGSAEPGAASSFVGDR